MPFAQRSRCIAWLVVAALLAQPLLVQSLLGKRALATAAGAQNVLVICTANGFETITLPADFGLPDSIPDAPPNGSDAPGDTPLDHEGAMADCLACLVKALGQLEAPARLSEPLRYRYDIGAPVIEDQCDVQPIRHSALHSRAPPHG